MIKCLQNIFFHFWPKSDPRSSSHGLSVIAKLLVHDASKRTDDDDDENEVVGITQMTKSND